MKYETGDMLTNRDAHNKRHYQYILVLTEFKVGELVYLWNTSSFGAKGQGYFYRLEEFDRVILDGFRKIG
tara:strand:+ start:9557 stop:9766 length:210 start_codon:yes stop_codon:yes gene_type:complete